MTDLSKIVGFGIFCLALFVLPAAAATTQLRIASFAPDGKTLIAEKTVDYLWMEANLPVQGDGKTHYYAQGPTFNESDPYDPDESQNVLTRDWGAVKGTDVKDLCNLVGGMRPGDSVKIKAVDGLTLTYPYDYVCAPDPRQGPMVVCWYNGGPDTNDYERQGIGYPPNYTTAMRLVMFADRSGNPWGYHVFGNQDMFDCWAPQYRYNFSKIWPSSGGVSEKYVSEILVYQGSSGGQPGPGQTQSAPDTIVFVISIIAAGFVASRLR
jgi:hypothetical protein